MIRLSRTLSAGVFGLLAMILGWVLPLQAQVKVGETVAAQIESPHPYSNGDASLPVVWTHTLHHPGASFLKLHFAQFALGPGDAIRILDGQGRLVTAYSDEWNAQQTFWA